MIRSTFIAPPRLEGIAEEDDNSGTRLENIYKIIQKENSALTCRKGISVAVLNYASKQIVSKTGPNLNNI